MRVVKAIAAGSLLTWLITGGPDVVAQQDTDKKVSGGITVQGWQGRADSGAKQALTINDSRFAPEGSGFRLTTGPAAIYWNPTYTATGEYTVKASFTEQKQTFNHPHPFGIFIGGSQLDGPTPTLLYCVAYRDGTFLVRQFVGGKITTLAKKNAHDAVKKAAAPDESVTQEVGWRVSGDRAECLINGTAVWSVSKGSLVAGALDGQTGIRVSHNADALVTDFVVEK